MSGALAGVCARCGCTDWTARTDDLGRACWWLQPGLCSACATTKPDRTPPAAAGLPVVTLLEFERSHPGISAGKAEIVRRTFGIGFARWAQLLRRAVRSRAALEHDALLAYQVSDAMENRARRRAALITRRAR